MKTAPGIADLRDVRGDDESGGYSSASLQRGYHPPTCFYFCVKMKSLPESNITEMMITILTVLEQRRRMRTVKEDGNGTTQSEKGHAPTKP